MGKTLCEMLEADDFEHLSAAGGALGLRHAAHAETELDVPSHCEVRKQ